MSANPQRQSSHLRRMPAHLSVSLRHDRSSASGSAGAAAAGGNARHSAAGAGNEFRTESGLRKRLSPTREPSGDSAKTGGSGESASAAAQKWFEKSNNNPSSRFDGLGNGDDEPPFFQQRQSSSLSEPDLEPDMESDRVMPPSSSNIFQDHSLLPQLVTNNSSNDDYRSVIDDLTVENKKLKERLRKYEKSQDAHLDKDKLFELRIHGLPAYKRRELENTLHAFASSVDGSTGAMSARGTTRGSRQPYASIPHSSNNPSSSSTSNSRPIDSAYASMSASGQTSSASQKIGVKAKQAVPPPPRDQKVQSFLHGIPEGLLPKRSPVMTEKSKKKIVVRRLEELFTGKSGLLSGVGNSQPLQQQEVSKEAAKADRIAEESDGQYTQAEGVREAHILASEMALEKVRPPKSSDEQTTNCPGPDTSMESSDDSSDFPEQRPTRPLDLDPDRAQVPADNVEYIRHLGLSTPQLITNDSSDAPADAHGWIYLNLLINMAQLHIINVTPDFVRSALSDVSAKFQLSRDGRKIRWRGGSEGTRLSSDSGASSSLHASVNESDSPAENGRKRRRLEGSPPHKSGADERGGKFSAAPLKIGKVDSAKPSSGLSTAFHYKPIFYHQTSSREEYSTGDSIAPTSCSPYEEARERSAWGQRSYSGSSSKRQRDDGAIVFYVGAPFCTDLSGERGDIITPVHVTDVGKDGFSNHTYTATGCKTGHQRQMLSRTTSGSFLPFRPMKDYSMPLPHERPRTPDLIREDSDVDMEFSPKWSAENVPQFIHQADFEACGLGGTTPADHFAINVQTQRTILGKQSRSRLSKFSAPGSKSRRFAHEVSKSSLDSFSGGEKSATADTFTVRLAAMSADSPPLSTTKSCDFPVKSKVLDISTRRLRPSKLPPPANYFGAASSGESSSECSSEEEDDRVDIKRLKQRAPYNRHGTDPHFTALAADETMELDAAAAATVAHSDKKSSQGAAAERDDDDDYDDDMEDNGEEYDDDDDDDESIDMLAHARRVDPETVMAREHEFDNATGNKFARELPAGSSAATVGGGSGYSSASS